MVEIIVRNLIQGNLDHEDGSRLYHQMQSALKKEQDIFIDFSEMDIVTSSFMNTSFRMLAYEYPVEYLKHHIHIKNSNTLINRMIKESLDPKFSASLN